MAADLLPPHVSHDRSRPEPSLTTAVPPIRVRGAAVTGPFRLEVPYSIGNVGPGFDRFGLALARPVECVDLRTSEAASFAVVGDPGVPRRWEENAFGVAFDALLRRLGQRAPRVRVRLHKGYRGGSGLGSSGASSAAGALAAALLLGASSEDPEVATAIIEAAGEGEAAAVGTGHLDNVLASLYGGFVHLERRRPLEVRGLRPHLEGTVVVAVPSAPLATRTARAALPAWVSREDAVGNLSHAAALLHAFQRGDARSAAAHLEDRLAEPYRAPLVPGFEEARRAGLRAGAWGVALAGSGPALFALAPSHLARRVAFGLVEGLHRAGAGGEAFLTRIAEGPRRCR